MRFRVLCLSMWVALLGCATAPSRPVEAPNATSGPAESAPDEPTKATAAVEEPSGPSPTEEPAVEPELNARYDQEDSADVWAKRFEREGREVRDRKADVIAALDIESGEIVADIGAGTGLYTLDFAKAVGPQGRVMAVDVQDYFLEHVSAKAKRAGLSNVETVKATHESVGLEANSVDLAFFCDVFHHVEYPRTYLATVYAALEPGGRLAVIDFIRPDEKTATRDDQWLLGHVRASPQQFRREFEDAGFVLKQELDLLEDNFFFVFEKPKNGG